MQAYSRLIHPYLRLKYIKRQIKKHMLRDVKNPAIFRNILLQPYSDIFSTLQVIIREIKACSEPVF